MQFVALLIDSFRASIDRKIFWVLVVVTLLIVASMFCIGFENGRMSIMFGLWQADGDAGSVLGEIDPDMLVAMVVWFFLNAILGWVGIAMMIVATASVFPTMMERGAIDVLLSKPIGRVRLFLYKYVSSMMFVFLQATLFVVLTFLVMGIRWGMWQPGYLLAVPLLVLLFSYIFCVSVLAGIKTGSTAAAILISLGTWVLFAVVHQAPAIFEVAPSLKNHAVLYHGMRLASWVPPKTGDFDYLAAHWAGVGTSMDMLPKSVLAGMTEERIEQLEQAREIEQKELMKNPIASIGSSLLFEAAIVLWAMVIFARRDY